MSALFLFFNKNQRPMAEGKINLRIGELKIKEL